MQKQVKILKGLQIFEALKILNRFGETKNAVFQKGFDFHLLPYFGVLDWQDFGAALKETGFSGVLSFEAAPSGKLPNDIFEDMCRSLCKMGKLITN